MPVLELTQLRLKGVAVDDPSLLESLSNVRGKLQTSSQFYSCIEDPTLIFILGIWPSLEAHHDFLASPARDEVLGPQEELADFQWSIHMPLNEMAFLPLDAPVLSIERLTVKEDCVDAYNQATAEDAQLLATHTQPFNVANGWRCDANPGLHEAFIFTGWETKETHTGFATKVQETTTFPAIKGLYTRLEVYHARNMER
jgi:heme-degrading monooxygenase HmoA